MGSVRAKLVFLMIPILSVLLASLSSSNGQVTFSRDWKAGKRSVPLPAAECSTSLSTASTLAHMLISELRTVAACETMSLLDRRLDHPSPLHSHDPLDTPFPLPLAVTDKR